MRKIDTIINRDNWHKKPKNQEEESKHEVSKTTNKTKKKKDTIENRKDTKTEAVIFIPFTPNTTTKKLLQEWDNEFSRSLNIPRI